MLKPYLAGDYGFEWTPEELVEVAVSHGPQAEPGTDVHYSNTNYTVLGLLVEAVSNNTLGDELEARLFEPLGLDRHAFRHRHRDPRTARQRVPGRRTRAAPGRHRRQPIALLGRLGNLVSNATDVARFYEALLGGEVISDESLEAMKTVVEEEPGVERGLGLARGSFECSDWYGHDGSVPGYYTRRPHPRQRPPGGPADQFGRTRRLGRKPEGPGGRRRADERRPLSLIPFRPMPHPQKRRKNHDNDGHTRAADHNTATGRPCPLRRRQGRPNRRRDRERSSERCCSSAGSRSSGRTGSPVTPTATTRPATSRSSRAGYAVTTDDLDLGGDPAGIVRDEIAVDFRIEAESSGGEPIFVGLARTDDAE